MRPLIGIPLCLDDRGRWRKSREYLYIDTAYAKAIADSGGAALHLPIQAEPESLLRRIDGLLLPGGDDLPPPDPERYSDIAFDLAPTAQLDFDRRLRRGRSDRSGRTLRRRGLLRGRSVAPRENAGASPVPALLRVRRRL